MTRRKLTVEQEEQLVQEYLQGESMAILKEKYGYKTNKSITDKVKKHCDNYEEAVLQARKNRKGWHYSFKTIKNNFDAYFIGLLMTDGYLTTRGRDIGIDLTDEDCIAFLSKTIGKDYKTYKDGGRAFDKYKRQPRHRLILTDITLVKEAERYGIIHKKTENLKGFSLLEKEYEFLPYLIRGIIDGDGCIFKTSYGAPAFYIISQSEAFLIWLKELMEKKLFFKDLNLVKTTDNLFKLHSALNYNIQILITLIYNKPYGMNRKYEKLRKTFRDYNRTSLVEEGIVQTTTNK